MVIFILLMLMYSVAFADGVPPIAFDYNQTTKAFEVHPGVTVAERDAWLEKYSYSWDGVKLTPITRPTVTVPNYKKLACITVNGSTGYCATVIVISGVINCDCK